MPTIAFACPHCGQGGLEAHLGTAAQFGPPVVDNGPQWAEITRRRQEYIGRMVMQAIVTHVIYGPCTALPLEECAAVQPGYGHRCNRAIRHTGDHMVQADHPSGVRIIARWPQLTAVPDLAEPDWNDDQADEPGSTSATSSSAVPSGYPPPPAPAPTTLDDDHPPADHPLNDHLEPDHP